MGKNFYIFSSGRLRRKENTLFLESANKSIPVEEVEQIYLFGEIDLNTKLLDFLSQKGIVLHTFNHYGYYSGSYYPREERVSGSMIIKQVEVYKDPERRLEIAKKFVEGAIHNSKRNLEKREGFEDEVEKMRNYETEAQNVRSINELMLTEAHAKRVYYSTFERITSWEFGGRSMHPPTNPLNALISFGNSLLYAEILKEIYLTPLHPSISFLHEPFERRFSLSLDVAEVFKPVLVDKLIFNLINLGKIKEEHFLKELNFTYLTEEGRKIFVKEFDETLETTIVHRKLKRKIKYRNLIRFELYKIMKDILGEEKYSPLKVWW